MSNPNPNEPLPKLTNPDPNLLTLTLSEQAPSNLAYRTLPNPTPMEHRTLLSVVEHKYYGVKTRRSKDMVKTRWSKYMVENKADPQLLLLVIKGVFLLLLFFLLPLLKPPGAADFVPL